MTVTPVRPPDIAYARADSGRPVKEPADGRAWLIVAMSLAIGLVAFLYITGENGPGALRNPHPAWTHNVDGWPRAVEPYLGWEHWPLTWEILTTILTGSLFVVFVRKSWRARRMHNGLVALFATGGQFAFDPIYNWLGYFPTDPRWRHIPHGATPWNSIAPTFEPVVFLPMYVFWLTLPALFGHWVYTKVKARARPGGFISRHPIITLLITCKLSTFPWDFTGFRMGILTDVFMFSQAPGPLLSGGKTDQMQLLWEPLLFPLTILGTSLLFYRDENGRTLHGRAARRLRTFARIPRITEVFVAWAIVGSFYVAALTGMAALRFTGQDDTVAQPWPYEDTVIYDPDGLYKRSGVTAPTRSGALNWSIRRPNP
jgi:hypothetical protein